jgi:crossover junction endodeoxyribonuclease RusA
VEFFVPGVPAPQGSKNQFGGEASKFLKPWRDSVINEVLSLQDSFVFFGPVEAWIEFRFPRPKSHFGTGRNAERLKSSAPDYKVSAPDLDKLCRAVLDALVAAGTLRDDALVVRLVASKTYDSRPGAKVVITDA